MQAEKNGQQFSLKTIAANLGIQFDEKELHRALSDAKLLTEVSKRIIDPVKIKSWIFPAKKVKIRTNEIIVNIHDARIKYKKLSINCPSCGCFLKKVEGWMASSKQIWGLFRCSKCHNLIAAYILINTHGNNLKYNKKCKVINRDTFDYLERYFINNK